MLERAGLDVQQGKIIINIIFYYLPYNNILSNTTNLKLYNNI